MVDDLVDSLIEDQRLTHRSRGETEVLSIRLRTDTPDSYSLAT